MKQVPQTKTMFPMFVLVFFISIFIAFGIMEFRHTKFILNEYENSIQQIAINKSNLFIEDLRAVSISAAKKIESEKESISNALEQIPSFDHRITNVYLINKNGKIHSSSYGSTHSEMISDLALQAITNGTFDVITSGVHIDPNSQFKVINMIVPVKNESGLWDGALAICFRYDHYQKEMMQEFLDNNYRIAVFDTNNYPIIWPFENTVVENYFNYMDNFYHDGVKYKINSSVVEKSGWKVYFLFKENNFELYRAITILLLVFALYACLYQLLLEFWGVNTAKTYFENIDFAIFNQIHEGVIIANNSGLILFANDAAHKIFSDRRNSLRNIKLRELFGNIEFHENNDRAFNLTLKFGDKLLKSIHSPIIKKNRILGSLTVIRTGTRDDCQLTSILDKVIETVPQGIIFVDKNHQVTFANLSAKYLIGNLNIGSNIDIIDQQLANHIYSHIDSGSVSRVGLDCFGLSCDTTPVYDADGIYLGTIVVLLNP